MASKEVIRAQLNNCLEEARFPQWEHCYKRGKVRDMYLLPGKRIIITTDRQSAFDHVLGTIPFKGQVLNRMAQYWFGKTQHIVPNHVLAVPDANVTVAREVEILPVEVVVRAYLTGSTDTSAWMNYQAGRDPYGLKLPPGLAKNTRFEVPVITPTSKSEGHDQPMSVAEVVEHRLVNQGIWQYVQHIALRLFALGRVLADKQGLILVDTKYEFGLDKEGNIILADEIHTPDSSRYWEAATYEERHARGEEPESLDKEFLRLWLREKGISDTNIPTLDDDIRVEVAERYINLCERITGQEFQPQLDGEPVLARIERAIEPYF